MDFDFGEIRQTRFGVGIRQSGEMRLYGVGPDASVRATLGEIAEDTWDRMAEIDEDPVEYDPANTYGGSNYLAVMLDDPLAEVFREIHETQTFEPGGNILENPARISCYFARLVDGNGLSLTAVRRATQFKGMVKKKGRMVRIGDDSVTLVSHDVFLLDDEFDVLVDDDMVHILHSGGFVQVGGLNAIVRAAASRNLTKLKDTLGFLDWKFDTDSWKCSLGVARRLSSIARQQLQGISVDLLKDRCQAGGVPFTQTANGLSFSEDSMPGLLDALGRRFYEQELIPGVKERYRAGNRTLLP